VIDQTLVLTPHSLGGLSAEGQRFEALLSSLYHHIIPLVRNRKPLLRDLAVSCSKAHLRPDADDS
jgi:hypothetical protein